MDNHAHAALRTRYFRFFRHQNLLSDLVRRRQCWLEHPAGSGDERMPLKIALPGRSAEFAAQLWVFGQSLQSTDQSVDVTRRNEGRDIFGAQNVANAWEVRHDDGQTGGHIFQQLQRRGD